MTDWVGEYRATRGRITDLVARLDHDDATARVPACPDWCVRDVVAHLVGMAAALGSGDFPSGDTQAWIDAIVDKRRDRSLDDLVAEWHACADAIDAFLANLGPGGGQLVYDAVAHEHDIRHAVGRRGTRDSSSVLACADAVSMLLAADLQKVGLPAVRITSNGRTWDVGEGEPGLAIELEPFELLRVFGSRRSERQMRALPWEGDLDRYLPALAHHPFPVDDIDE